MKLHVLYIYQCSAIHQNIIHPCCDTGTVCSSAACPHRGVHVTMALTACPNLALWVPPCQTAVAGGGGSEQIVTTALGLVLPR